MGKRWIQGPCLLKDVELCVKDVSVGILMLKISLLIIVKLISTVKQLTYNIIFILRLYSYQTLEEGINKLSQLKYQRTFNL